MAANRRNPVFLTVKREKAGRLGQTWRNARTIDRLRLFKHPSRTLSELIEAMYPELPKIELFARNTRPGWMQWGNQLEAAE
jgi:N6-adenosine-specific RNA methylase IME4